jgi:hypothetical protein
MNYEEKSDKEQKEEEELALGVASHTIIYFVVYKSDKQ